MAELLRKGDKGRSVKTLQRQLIRENNNALVVGEVDGEYGSETENAVLTFQKKHSDLGNTGVADLPTQARLIKVILLKEGSKGRGVKMLQEALIRFTINIPSGADGIYGSDTTKAVKTFQTQNGILADGQAGAVTLDTLDKALNVYYVGPGATGTIYTSVVRMVQSQLIQSKIDLPLFGVDGDYGTETTNGVKQFQKREGLPVDGVAGPRTMNLLDIEANHAFTKTEIIDEAKKRGMLTETVNTTISNKYIQKLESSPVFINSLSGSSSTLKGDVLRIKSGNTNIVTVFGELKVNPNTVVFAIFDNYTEELIRLSIIESLGTLYTDKAKVKTIEADGTEIDSIEVMWVDLEDQHLQLQLDIRAALKDADSKGFSTLALDWGTVGCNIIAGVSGEITSFGIVFVVGSVPGLVAAAGGLVLGAVYGTAFC
ncbi:peptidoglycan-binding protein [Priestia megaterium]|uniref:peptidoglycan-binding domain-containing protein n=1 Tax=Priestia megaterium TaxID=1404 RepID=UPI0015967496|nr:peptidoglycan-binding protein [Priestia megaterium]